MKRVLAALVCLAVPGMFFLNAWEGYRYNDLSDKVALLEKQQKDLLEANRDAIGQIAYESSPDRVAEKATGLGLLQADQSVVTRQQSGTAVSPAAAAVGGADAEGAAP
jgi:cell division protein FtsL